MYCKKTLLSYEDKQVNLTIQLNDEEWEGLLFECRRRNKNVEDCLIEACDAMFRLAEGKSNND
jgi:hypothetical protein